jgi:hypothetical protein
MLTRVMTACIILFRYTNSVGTNYRAETLSQRYHQSDGKQLSVMILVCRGMPDGPFSSIINCRLGKPVSSFDL